MPLDLEALTGRLPAGYRARDFTEDDRDALVALRNSKVPPIEQGDADEWRDWERMAPDDSLVRFTIEAPGGSLAGSGNVGKGSMMRMPDGAVFGGVTVAPEHRRKGIGSAVLATLEALAREMGAPRFLSGGSERWRFGVEWAEKRGFREIGRRIESYVDLATFEPERYRDLADRPRGAGIRLCAFSEVLADAGDDAREKFFHDLWEAEAPMWDDVPWATPTPHWSYEQFRRMAVESGKLIGDASIIAYAGSEIAGFTTAGKKDKNDGYTWMTGVAREHRGKGLAHALKVETLARAKALGTRAMFTTNDEPNNAMRGVNAKLGYQMLPANVQLEKTLA
ncbi:MAG TPA: GNAT family N-acetyltransferase [Candidatus Limnocylindria bacterium]|nr:GNAT family N-acetyltransferase [Candidatus Limnocylindria bacterium]